MSALSDRMAGMTRKQAHELNDREAINEFDRLAAEREREDAPPLKERQASWGETREELIALRAELSALKATPPEGPTKEQAWASYRAAQGAVIDAGFNGDVSPRDAIEALSARLAALEARRCDGCAHAAPKWRYYPNDGLRCARLHADVPVDFSCAAWTEKP